MVIAVIILSFPGFAGGTLAAEPFPDIEEAGFHAPAITILDHMGIIDGTQCAGGRFCPNDPIRRWVMAVWVNRAIGLEAPGIGGGRQYADAGYPWWAGYTEQLADLGITVGCGARATYHCPYAVVTHGQMAGFLRKAFDLPQDATSLFADIEGGFSSESIEAFAATGIPGGCAVYPDYFCPEAPVSRGQMATALARLLGLVPAARFSDAVAEYSIGHLVSRYTTYHPCCRDRVVNIHRFADKLSGAVVPPGKLFSLNGHVGKRTGREGFRPAGTLVNGTLVNTVGGGVSQAATTFYNAMFWGGYQPVFHRPHSIYFPRYPEGIEATINWPDLDLVFRNDTSHHILIVTDYTPTSLTIEFYGDNDGRILVGEWEDGEGTMTVVSEGGPDARVVSASVSERFRWRSPPAPLIRPNSRLDFDERKVAQTALVGWSVNVTRTVETQGSSSTLEWTVRYKPTQRIVEVHPCTLTDSCPDEDEESELPAAEAA